MSYHELQVVGATAVAIGAAALLMYRSTWQDQAVLDPPPTQTLTGQVFVKISPGNLAEYQRDFERFEKAGFVLTSSESFPLSAARADFHSMYSMSTSMGMDVLTFLGISPPVLSQPHFVVTEKNQNRATLFAYIGNPKGSSHLKFTDWVIRVSLRKSEDVLDFDIEPANGIVSMRQYIEQNHFSN